MAAVVHMDNTVLTKRLRSAEIAKDHAVDGRTGWLRDGYREMG